MRQTCGSWPKPLASQQLPERRPGEQGVLTKRPWASRGREPSEDRAAPATHRITESSGWEGPSVGHLVQPSCRSRVTYSRLHRTSSRRVLNISREGDSTTFLGSLFQGSVTHLLIWAKLICWGCTWRTGIAWESALPLKAKVPTLLRSLASSTIKYLLALNRHGGTLCSTISDQNDVILRLVYKTGHLGTTSAFQQRGQALLNRNPTEICSIWADNCCSFLEGLLPQPRLGNKSVLTKHRCNTVLAGAG